MAHTKKILLSIFFLVIGFTVGAVITEEFYRPPISQAAESTREGQSPTGSAVRPEQVFVEVSKKVTPAVVNISTTRTIKGGDENSPLEPFFNDPFFRRFFGEPFQSPGIPRERKEQSLGSGVIVDPKGYIITNNHVVSKADEIKVVLGDRREFKGKVVGSDPPTDIAVVKIDAKDLPTIPWGDSQKLQVGEYVLAVGNPFGLNQTVTMGIISAVGRANVGISDYEDFIQTDAAINPGNSGGALVNTAGELIGINTAIFTRSGGYMGIGFAVPSNMAKSVMEGLLKTGKVIRGWLGISIQEVTPALAKQFGLSEPQGALVADVLSNSPAEQAGIKRGDIILEMDGKPIHNVGELRNRVAETPIGKKMNVKVLRDGKEREIKVTIEEQPKEMAQGGRSGGGEETGTALSGVEVRNITPEIAKELGLPRNQQGIVVEQVEPGSVVEEAGLQRGDVIVEINRKPVKDINGYERERSKLKKDESVLLLINREGKTIFVTIGPS